MALSDHWPLFALRLTTPRLELRLPTDEHLEELLDLVRAGIHAPETMPFAVPWTDAPSPQRERDSLRHWWRARAELSPERWDLGFVVTHGGVIVGMQNILAADFVTLRTAETGSWLGLAHQGKGIGTEMRRAVVHFAFVHLGARSVTSSAFADNLASQHVSLAVGYEPNGTSVAARRGQRSEQVRFLLTKERWQSLADPLEVEVQGFDPCRSLLGVADAPAPG